MPAQVRKARADDAEAIARLNRQVQDQHAQAYPALFRPASRDTLTAAAFEDMLAAAEITMFVALDGAEVVGYLTAEVLTRPETPNRYGQQVLYIHQICVNKAARRKGYGRRLLDATLNMADWLGIARVELDTWEANTDARRFFESVGFREHNIRLSLDRPVLAAGVRRVRARAGGYVAMHGPPDEGKRATSET